MSLRAPLVCAAAQKSHRERGNPPLCIPVNLSFSTVSSYIFPNSSNRGFRSFSSRFLGICPMKSLMASWSFIGMVFWPMVSPFILPALFVVLNPFSCCTPFAVTVAIFPQWAGGLLSLSPSLYSSYLSIVNCTVPPLYAPDSLLLLWFFSLPSSTPSAAYKLSCFGISLIYFLLWFMALCSLIFFFFFRKPPQFHPNKCHSLPWRQIALLRTNYAYSLICIMSEDQTNTSWTVVQSGAFKWCRSCICAFSSLLMKWSA